MFVLRKITQCLEALCDVYDLSDNPGAQDHELAEALKLIQLRCEELNNSWLRDSDMADFFTPDEEMFMGLIGQVDLPSLEESMGFDEDDSQSSQRLSEFLFENRTLH